MELDRDLVGAEGLDRLVEVHLAPVELDPGLLVHGGNEVGPSVRWATAKPVKTDRRGPGQSGFSPGGGQSSYSQQGGGDYAPAVTPGGGGFDTEEEPF